MSRYVNSVTKNKKNPKTAAFASFFIPGLGHIYNGVTRKGIGLVLLAIIFASLWFFIIRQKQPEMEGSILVSSGTYVLLWAGSIYDVYKTAKETNRIKK